MSEADAIVALAAVMEITDAAERQVRRPRVGQHSKDWLVGDEPELPYSVEEASLAYGEALLLVQQHAARAEAKAREIQFAQSELEQMTQTLQETRAWSESCLQELHRAVEKETAQ